MSTAWPWTFAQPSLEHQVLPKLCKSSAKLCTKLRTKLYKSSTKSSTKGFAAPLPTQCTGHAVNGARSAQGVQGVSPLKIYSKLCSKLYSKPYTELQSSTNTQH